MNQIQNQVTNQSSLFNYAKSMADGKSESELEQIARNICSTKGIDYDDAVKQFNLIWSNDSGKKR